MKRHLCLLLTCVSLQAQDPTEAIFSWIYHSGTWDESGFSLSGSQVEIMQPYMQFLQDFLNQYEIQSVVDVGCGDWAFSRYIDWNRIEYFGIDIVPFVIERNLELFSQSNIHFILGNALEMDLPEADLLICKDTFQHLSNQSIKRLLAQCGKFKHCLFTDYVDPKTLSSSNSDIPNGNMHFIDLTKPPFNLKGEKVLLFQGVGAPKQTLHIQQSLN
ncbi:MAG: class I SAM-dependent methyltransferase [Simkaniaceae bacterium]